MQLEELDSFIGINNLQMVCKYFNIGKFNRREWSDIFLGVTHFEENISYLFIVHYIKHIVKESIAETNIFHWMQNLMKFEDFIYQSHRLSQITCYSTWRHHNDKTIL